MQGHDGSWSIIIRWFPFEWAWTISSLTRGVRVKWPGIRRFPTTDYDKGRLTLASLIQLNWNWTVIQGEPSTRRRRCIMSAPISGRSKTAMSSSCLSHSIDIDGDFHAQQVVASRWQRQKCTNTHRRYRQPPAVVTRQRQNKITSASAEV